MSFSDETETSFMILWGVATQLPHYRLILWVLGEAHARHARAVGEHRIKPPRPHEDHAHDTMPDTIIFVIVRYPRPGWPSIERGDLCEADNTKAEEGSIRSDFLQMTPASAAIQILRLLLAPQCSASIGHADETRVEPNKGLRFAQ